MRTFVILLLLLALASLVAAASCEDLSRVPLPHASVTAAQTVSAGGFAAPQAGPNGAQNAFRNLPVFCRVAVTLKPSTDSDIKIEVWMPASWNGNLEGVGNGAWAGTISYPAMAAAVADGYAAASTDTGHTGNNANFIPGHFEKVIDFSYRAVHEMTVTAKQVIGAFYGREPAYAYWNGCSTGGRQALTEAQRYPADYDGILAGAAAINTTELQGMQTWVAAETHKDEASYIPPAKYAALHKAALDACDALDGVKDGVIEDPTRCHFDPAVIACKPARITHAKKGETPPPVDGDNCLMPPQVELARKIYAGPKDAQSKTILGGLLPGSEMGWATLAGPKPMSLAVETYQYVVFRNPSWDYRTFDAEKDFARAKTDVGALMNSTDPNLQSFFAGHNGHTAKLLMYHGWADPGITPLNSVAYYKNVLENMGPAKATDSIRLFMVPGMGHCRGGDGTDTFGGVAALSAWVEKGSAPARIEASHATKGTVDKTRPLCPYPQTAVYKGTGNTNESANFVCQTAK